MERLFGSFLFGCASLVASVCGAADVVVVGGGPAGIGAALAAAKCGAKTVLVERDARLGGTTVSAEVLPIGLFHAWGRQVIDGPCWNLVTNAVALGEGALPDFARQDDHAWWKFCVRVNPVVYSALAAEALERAGVEVRFNAAACGIARGAGGWTLKLASDEGIAEIPARIVIDATGNAAVAARAGAKRIRSADAERQPGSYFFHLNTRGMKFDAAAVDAAAKRAVAAGELRTTDVVIGMSDFIRNGGGWGGYVPLADNSTATARAETNRRGREAMLRVLRFTRRQPGLEKATVVSAAPEVGVRETWRIVGEKTVTQAGYLSGRIDEDSLCYSYWMVDEHNAARKSANLVFHESGRVGTIPLGAMIPKGVEGMLVAGRAISSDHGANSALRVQASCMAIGQAAGAVAALAAKRGVGPGSVDLGEAKSALRAMGCIVPAEYGRIVSDVSALPEACRFFAGVLESRVAGRLPGVAGAALTVAYRVDPSLGGENARVTVKGARAEIAAARPRSLFYGMARLLEEMRWTPSAFALADGTWEIRPVKPVRIAYWARHFHNWYHMASAAELKRYAEDMMLMGMNGFDYQYLYPGVNRAGATAKEMAVFLANSKELYAHIRAMDADLLTGGGGNQIPDDSPEEWRGAPETDEMRCNLGFNACPAKPAALAYMLKSRKEGLATFKREGVAPKWFLHWPFDEGGCECDTCRPWGGNGFIGLCKKYDRLNKGAYPDAKTVLSTWIYHDDDYDGLWAYLAKPESKWIDGLMVDAHGDFPKYVLTHPLPRKIPIITFPEISMYHRWPWGGYGAIAMPARFERLFRQCEKVVDGFMFYSEGLSEDVNKFLVTRLYANPSAHGQPIVRDYARLFLPGIVPEDFARFCAMLEESHEFPIQDTQLAAEPPPAEFFAKYGPRAKEIAAFAQKLERDLLPSVRKDWRWRQLKLRTEIDAHAFTSRKLLTDGYAKMARELIDLYHVDPQEGYYEDYTNHKAVRPYLPDVRLEGRPGETVEYRVRRTNRTERDIVVKPEAKCVPKAFAGKAGVVRDDGSVDWNGTKTLKPGESVMLAGRIRIPADAKEGHYGAHVLFPHGRSRGSEYWWISLEVLGHGGN